MRQYASLAFGYFLNRSYAISLKIKSVYLESKEYVCRKQTLAMQKVKFDLQKAKKAYQTGKPFSKFGARGQN